MVFMHQVDDFAIATPDQHAADILLDQLDEKIDDAYQAPGPP